MSNLKRLMVLSCVSFCVYLLIMVVFSGHWASLMNYIIPIQTSFLSQVAVSPEDVQKHYLKNTLNYNKENEYLPAIDHNQKYLPDARGTTDKNVSLEKGSQDCSIHGIRGIYSEPLRPGCIMQHISIAEALEQHQAKTLSTCSNKCTEALLGCNATTFQHWKELNIQNIQFVPFVKQGQYIFPWEKDYLSQPPLYDANLLPSLKLSVVTIDSPRFVNNTVSCDLGDSVSGRIYLKDSYGNQRTMGGDEVRVWITSTTGYSSAGSVQDLNNGSYAFSFRCLWSGDSKLNIAVPYPREFLRAVLQHSLAGVTLYQLSLFKNGDISETTLCSPIPNVPSRPCVCNITSFQRFPFYCGRPKDSRLSCDDWSGARIIEAPRPYNVTPAEVDLIKQASGSAQKNAICHNIKVLVGHNTGNLPILEPCNKLNASITWNAETPHGYFSPGYRWNSLQCRRPQMTISFTTQCLRNTTVTFFGDSNSRKMYHTLAAFSLCQQIGVEDWPKVTSCRNEKDDISISNNPHDYPLLYSVNFTTKPEYKDTPSQIDNIPSSGKHMIVIHYYLHYTYYHLSALTARMDAILAALERLLRRNPNVVIGIRGPHISTYKNEINHALGGDSLAPFYKKFLKDKFESLSNRVFFLDGWEMSIATENESFHPLENVQKEVLLTVLAHFCP